MQPVLNRYLDKVIKDNRAIDARGVMQVNRMIELTMDEVFIALSVRMGKQEKSDFERSAAVRKFIRFLSEQAESVSGWDMPDFMGERLAPGAETGISTEELWKRHNAWVLLGDPGAGKTTLLKHFALQGAREYREGTGYLPILLPLRLFAAEWEQRPQWAPQYAVLNYLAGKGLSEIGFEQEREREELLGIFKQAMNAGRALFLFDGLDEQRSADMQRKSVAAIESLLKSHPGNRFLVSSRIIGYDAAPLGSGFNAATLEPFNDEQMAAFFRRWIYAVEKHEDIVVDASTQKRAEEKAAQLIEQVKNNAGIRALATNPLLCTIIGLIRRQGATLPQLRAELYKLCIDTFIFNWELQKRRRDDQQGSLNKEQTQAVLEELALHFHENCPENRAPQQIIAGIIRDFLVRQEGMSLEDAAHKGGQLLGLIRDVSGLLIERGNNEYGFFHLTFQEYLAARAITRRKRDIERYLGQHLFEPRWREVIRLAAAHQGMKDEETGSEFIEAIRRCKHPREAVMHYAFRLAFLCLKEARVELETSDRLFREWVRLYLEQPELRYLLLRLMAQPGADIRRHPDALQPLLAALKNEDDGTRSGAAEALGVVNDPVAVPALLDALKDKHEDTRWHAARSLGKIKDPSAVSDLLATLKHGDVFARWCAAQVLGEIKDPAAAPALLLAALKDTAASVRWSAAEALGEIKDPAAVPALLTALQDEDTGTRARAADALGGIKDPAAVPALLAALQDEDASVRWSAAQALGEIKDPAAVPALLAVLKDDDASVRQNAVQALGEIKAPVAVPALLAVLKDETGGARFLGEIDARWSAARALGEIKDPAAVPTLLDALQDESRDARESAAIALGKIKDPAAVPALLDALKDKDTGVRARAAEALGEFKDPVAVPALLATLNDRMHPVRWSAADALGQIKDPVAVPVLLAALKDNNASVRQSAAHALGKIKDPAAAPALLATLKDKDERVRWSAVEAIEIIDLGAGLCPD